MKGILIRWVVSAISLYITYLLAHALGLGIILSGVLPAFIAVAILAVVNALIRPLIILLTLPLNCLTLGLFTFVINVLMFWLAGSVTSSFVVKGPVAAIFGSIVMGLISGSANHLINREE
jgi:putative membrane protein